MTIQILSAREERAPEIAALCATLGYEATAQEVTARLHQILSSPDHKFLVAQVEGRIVGFCHGYKRVLVEVPEAIEIGGLVVNETMQHQGVGSDLVAAMEDWAREVGIKLMVLSSNTKRTEAHKFYEHLGYVILKQQHAFQKKLD